MRGPEGTACVFCNELLPLSDPFAPARLLRYWALRYHEFKRGHLPVRVVPFMTPNYISTSEQNA